ncbi:MAG: DUF6455 family protein [Cypionkella sp.]|nr:DUF6455 family protein [Cypionkella sp.]
MDGAKGAAMIGYADSPLAWGLTRGMARLLGVNLPSAVVEGWLSRKELGQLVSRCEACGQKTACTNWLAVAHGSRCPPVFCPNKTALEDLTLPH